MLFRPPKPVGMTLNLAPMVDVMMCLIIFFLLASELVSVSHRPIKLPYAVAARDPEPGELGDRIVIDVRPTADASRTEYVVQTWDGKRIAERVLFEDQVAAYLQNRARQAADATRLRCVVRADRSVAYGDVEVVLRGCGLAKIAKVTFGAHTGEDPEERRG
ncbi:MAG: biopolymer transporter ExbD [Planctomycetes bacterium]|nr:biopolymer transporter ExbD [Planctomycetota bacterium]